MILYQGDIHPVLTSDPKVLSAAHDNEIANILPLNSKSSCIRKLVALPTCGGSIRVEHMPPLPRIVPVFRIGAASQLKHILFQGVQLSLDPTLKLRGTIVKRRRVSLAAEAI